MVYEIYLLKNQIFDELSELTKESRSIRLSQDITLQQHDQRIVFPKADGSLVCLRHWISVLPLG